MQSAKKKAVIFDLDGTIIDTIRDIAAALNRALDFYGYPSRTVDEVRSFIGNGSLVLMKRALGGEPDEQLCLDLRARFRVEYENDMYSKTVPYEGIAELFDELHSKGASVAVVTNKDDKCAVPMVKHFFGDRVDICRGVRKDNDRKPSTEMPLEVLLSLGASPEEAVLTGDGLADLEAAKNCGIDYIPVGYGYFPRERLLAGCGKEPVETVEALRRELLKYFD